MGKIRIEIENGDNFEFEIDGEVENITVSTNVGDYEINKKVSTKEDSEEDLLFNTDFMND